MVKLQISQVGITQLRAVNGKLAALGKIDAFPRELIARGVRFAKAHAPGPHQPNSTPSATGSLSRGISGVYGTKNAGVKVMTPNHPDGRKRPYHLWHHGRGVYKQVRDGPTAPRGGDPDFLFKTGRYLRKEARKGIVKEIKETWQKS